MARTILFLTDSLGFPREEEGLRPEDLYTDLFPEEPSSVSTTDSRDRLGIRSFTLTRTSPRFEIRQVSNTHWDTGDLLSYVRGLPPTSRSPDLALVHIGIVDCSPRVLRRGTQKWLVRRRLLGPAFRFAARRFRRTLLPLVERLRGERVVYVPPDGFRENLSAVIAGLGAGRLALLSIVRASDSGVYRSPGWNEQIDSYNSILGEVAAAHEGVDLLDLNARLDRSVDISSDGFHLTAHGHEVAREVLRGWVLRDRGWTGAAGA